MSEYNIKVSKLEDGTYKLKINNYSRYEVEEVEALAIKYLQKQIEQKDIKIKELSQWDTNKDTRNSRQRIANNKLKDQLQQKENIINELDKQNKELGIELSLTTDKYEKKLFAKENIIKEVREKLKELKIGSQEVENEWAIDICDIVLEILDKEVN